MLKFKTLMADPPWPGFNDKGNRMAPEYSGVGTISGRDNAHYETVSMQDLTTTVAEFVMDVAADDAVLFLWCPNALVLDGDATELARSWGFEPKQLIPWLKVDKNGKPRMGGGHYTRVCTEMLVLARRRKTPKVLSHAEPGVIIAPRREHSQKPEEAYELIEKLCEGPRLEMFAREHRLGWASIGQQLNCTIEQAAYWFGNIEELETGCIRWQGEESELTAQRTAWQIFNGELVESIRVVDRCDGSCVNPEHLKLEDASA